MEESIHRLVTEEEKELATSRDDFKKAILKALEALGGEGTTREIYTLVITKFLTLKDPYDYLFIPGETGKPTTMMAVNNHSFALKFLQEEKKIRATPNGYVLI